MANKPWTRAEVLIAINLYCQLPFGQFTQGNSTIKKIAPLLGRTPSSLAMKLCNLASLDPVITSTGRKGLEGASKLDKTTWEEFIANPDAIGYESQLLVDQLTGQSSDITEVATEDEHTTDYSADTISTTVQVRVRQSFFRKSILSSYNNQCCMTGISEPRLLIASHIVPWKDNPKQRLNPANGLCLSALHDKAFDIGLITVTPDYLIQVSPALRSQAQNGIAKDYLLGLHGQKITMPSKFAPHRDFLAYHQEHVFRQSE
ncbi:HNH endonuclease [Leeia oryzae]|uniref:HNH endonuclease n=1 Tax=Leeia oryzae TaxID=356662 RepID=UPI000370D82A|nr:HNH endonuclease [Leeia oryzae]